MVVIKPNKIITQAGCRSIIKGWGSIHLDQRVQIRIVEMDHKEVMLGVIRLMQKLWRDKKVRPV